MSIVNRAECVPIFLIVCSSFERGPSAYFQWNFTCAQFRTVNYTSTHLPFKYLFWGFYFRGSIEITLTYFRENIYIA